MKIDKAKEFLVVPISRDIQENRQRMDEIVDEAVFHIREEAFDAAEQWLRTQLLRWRDPKKELPEADTPVLVKFKDGTYSAQIRYKRAPFDFGWSPDAYALFVDEDFIVGWRPIYENQ